MMNEKEYIQILLDRYMAADTTEEEELFLSDYFSSRQDIPSEWRSYSIMFRGLGQCGQRKVLSKKTPVLRWSVMAAVIIVIIAIASLLLLHREETTVKPDKPIEIAVKKPDLQITASQSENNVEHKDENPQVSQRSNSMRSVKKSTQTKIIHQPMKRERITANHTTHPETHQYKIVKHNESAMAHNTDIEQQTDNIDEEISSSVISSVVIQPASNSNLPDLSEHRNKMRECIQASFDNSSFFITQNDFYYE